MPPLPKPEPTPQVLYVIGHPRSGSTILGNLLDEIPGVFHGGELHYLWTPDVPGPRQRCGCGLTVRRCPLWRRIFARAFKTTDPGEEPEPPSGAPTAWGLPGAEPERVYRLQQLGHRRVSPRGRRAAAEYRRIMGRLYRAIAAETGARLVVDSSKWPYDARMVAGVEAVELSFVHLVREPWGVVYSRLPRDVSDRPGSERPPSRARVLLESLRWMRSNVTAEWLTRRSGRASCTVRYEDFAVDPATVLRRIAALVDMEAAPSPLRGAAFELTPNHTVGGNRNRWQTGTVVVRPDRKWRHGMRRGDVALVSLVTWPYRLRFGYRAGGGSR